MTPKERLIICINNIRSIVATMQNGAPPPGSPPGAPGNLPGSDPQLAYRIGQYEGLARGLDVLTTDAQNAANALP